jgi:hypothetical protein
LNKVAKQRCDQRIGHRYTIESRPAIGILPVRRAALVRGPRGRNPRISQAITGRIVGIDVRYLDT